MATDGKCPGGVRPFHAACHFKVDGEGLLGHNDWLLKRGLHVKSCSFGLTFVLDVVSTCEVCLHKMPPT